MSLAEIRIEGAKELESKLTRLPGKVAKKVVTSSLRKGAAIIRRRTKSLAPRKTGTLRKSIITRSAKKSRNFSGVHALLQFFNTRKFPQLISNSSSGDRGFYPAAVEYGRAAKGKAGGRKVTTPKSFIRAGFQSSKKQAEAAVIKALRIGIAKAWRER